MRQYLKPAGIGLVVIGLVLVVGLILAGVRNLKAVFGLDPLIFLVIAFVFVASGAFLIDKGQ